MIVNLPRRIYGKYGYLVGQVDLQDEYYAKELIKAGRATLVKAKAEPESNTESKDAGRKRSKA